mgnify:CR=1 FL=1
MTPLTQHFTLEELTHSQVAARFGYDNMPPPTAITHLKMLAVLLEQVRMLLDVPLIVSSGYRSERVNLAVGGKPNSKHSLGMAADFTAPQYGSPLEVAQRISASSVLFDQLIHEFRRVDQAGARQLVPLVGVKEPGRLKRVPDRWVVGGHVPAYPAEGPPLAKTWNTHLSGTANEWPLGRFSVLVYSINRKIVKPFLPAWPSPGCGVRRDVTSNQGTNGAPTARD